MKKKHQSFLSNQHAITEIVGTILLLGISVILFSVVYLSIFSIPAQPSTPSTKIMASLHPDEDKIVFHHLGGEPIHGNAKILIHKGETTNEVLISTYAGDLWEMGETITYPIYNINDTYIDALIIDTDSNSIVTSAVLQKGYSTTNPYVETLSAKEISKESAKLYMNYDFVKHSGNIYFQYRKIGESSWISTTPVSTDGYDQFSEPLTNLEMNTKYQYQAVIEYDGNTLTGNVIEFTTKSPSLQTHIDDIPSIISTSPFNITTSGDPDLDNITLYYRYSSDGINWYAGDDDINWWNSDWSNRIKLRIDHEQVRGNLSFFPVLVNITQAEFSLKAQNNGNDFVFLDENEDVLSHEIESYDSNSGSLIAWVKLPKISHNTDTVFWLYFGNPACSNQEQIQDTWNNSFVSVYHLEDMLDATIQNNSLTDENTLQASGIINDCRQFSGNDNSFLKVTSSDFNLPNRFTASCWYYSSSDPSEVQKQYATLLNKEDSSQAHKDRNWWLSFTENQKYTWFKASSSSSESYIQFDTTHKDVEDDSWHHASISYDASLGIAQIITDGGKHLATKSSLGYSLEGQGDPFYIGREVGTNNRYFNGLIDEVRISSVQRSLNWTNTYYNMIVNQTSFISMISSEDEGWTKWDSSDYNPDENYQWFWLFPFAEFEGHYEFISIGQYDNVYEPWPEDADQECEYDI
jgi:hypothetical protein